MLLKLGSTYFRVALMKPHIYTSHANIYTCYFTKWNNYIWHNYIYSGKTCGLNSHVIRCLLLLSPYLAIYDTVNIYLIISKVYTQKWHLLYI